MQQQAFVGTDDTAASVISVLLLLAAVVLFAVAVGGIIVGSNQQSTPPPDVDFHFQGDADELSITRGQGDDFGAGEVTIEGSATAFETDDDSVTWADAPDGGSGTVHLGDKIRLGGSVDGRFALQAGRLTLIWHDSQTGETTVIATYPIEAE